MESFTSKGQLFSPKDYLRLPLDATDRMQSSLEDNEEQLVQSSLSMMHALELRLASVLTGLVSTEYNDAGECGTGPDGYATCSEFEFAD